MKENISEKIMSHNARLEDRKHLVLSGVLDVEKFDEHSVVLYTELGRLTVKGSELNVTRLDISELEGEMVIEGSIDSLDYDKGRTEKQKKSLIAKIMG